MEISLSFRVSINTDKETIIKLMKSHFEELKNFSEDINKFELKKNYIIISYNDDYNSDLALNNEDGFLYYQTNVDFFPSREDIALNEQILLSKTVVDIFKKHSILSEIVSEFEHLL